MNFFIICDWVLVFETNSQCEDPETIWLSTLSNVQPLSFRSPIILPAILALSIECTATPPAISKRSGVSQSMLSLVERGLRNPTMELMLRIADGIGVDLSVLVKKAKTNIPKKL